MISLTNRILFVDDDVATRHAFVRTLRRHGFVVDVAANANEATALANGSQYAVVATDYHMPGEDGLGLVRRIRTLQPDAAYLLITGAMELTLSKESTDAAMIERVIYKPWRTDDLVDAVKTSIDLHARRLADRHVRLAIDGGEQRPHRLLVVAPDSDHAPSHDTHLLGVLEQLNDQIFDVQQVTTVADALTAMRANNHDVILAVQSVRDTQGLSSVAVMHGEAQDVPIIVLSDTVDMQLATQVIKIGAQDCLSTQHLTVASLERALVFSIERKMAKERFEYLASYHHTTGLPNRILFRDRLQQALHRATRGNKSVGLLYLDLDRFKAVNDAFGHEAGNHLLREIGDRLRACARATDTVAHVSGDEFAVILEDINDACEAVVIAQRILKSLTQPIDIDSREVFITCSVGVAMFPEAPGIDELIENVEMAMYQAKRLGRNQCFVHRPETHGGVAQRLSFESDLSRALERNEFVLYYQPKIAIKSGALTGAEALIRWKHPRDGLVRPDHFIPLLEDTGLIIPVGAWVLQESCEQHLRWCASKIGPVTISVNLSARQFRGDDLVACCAKVLQQTGAPATCIKLELTESLLFDETDTILATLIELRRMGFGLSIDDFGTGYSSLGYLNRYPIEELKIDRSFIKDLPDDIGAGTIASAIIGLSHNLGLRVVAEGVETEEQVTFLRQRKCDEIQGYYYAKPMTSEDFEQWCIEHHRIAA